MNSSLVYCGINFAGDIKFKLLKSSYEEKAGVKREVIFVLIKLFKFDENSKHMYWSNLINSKYKTYERNHTKNIIKTFLIMAEKILEEKS